MAYIFEGLSVSRGSIRFIGVPLILGVLFLMPGCKVVEDLSNSVVFAPLQDINEKTSTTQEPPTVNADGIHVIRNHPGGRIIEVEQQRRALLNWGGPVRIEGFCASACVILTTLPNACLSADSRIGFHSASINIGPVGNAQIARYLRNGVLDQYLKTWQFVPTSEMHEVPAVKIVELDPQSKICGS